MWIRCSILFEPCHGRRKYKTDNMMQEGNVEKNKLKRRDYGKVTLD
jgi:hypothetical protein